MRPSWTASGRSWKSFRWRDRATRYFSPAKGTKHTRSSRIRWFLSTIASTRAKRWKIFAGRGAGDEGAPESGRQNFTCAKDISAHDMTMFTSMEPRTLQYIAKACAGEQLTGSPDVLARRVCTDSRVVRAGDVFFALSGDKFDGHEFLKEVM